MLFSMEKTIQILLGKIGELQKKQIFRQTEVSKRGENFNVFNVIGLWSEEVRLHSAMLAELLNPEGSHGCGDAFLAAFLREVLYNDENIHDLSKAIITTEYNIGCISEDGMSGGRIDILIEMPNESRLPTLIIENKIYAGDQANQLRRYYNWGLGHFYSPDKFKILYLTLDGSNPSSDSIGKGKDFNYETISYANNIRMWLKKCASIAYDKPKVRETIIQYNHLLDQITTSNMEDKNLLVEEIASNNDYLKNAVLLCSLQNEIIKKAIMGPIRQALENIQKIAQDRISPLTVEFEYSSFNENGGKLDWGFNYIIKEADKIVRLAYVFEAGLKTIYYGIPNQGTSHEFLVKQPVFRNKNEIWVLGWELMPNKYQNWNGGNLYNILEELTSGTFGSSEFYKTIINSIERASELFNI